MLVADLITFGRLFQSVGADTVKLQSPSMRRAFILGRCSRISLVDLGSFLSLSLHDYGCQT